MQNKNIYTTKDIVVATEYRLYFRYKHNHFYCLTKDYRCFNIFTKREVKLVSPNKGRCWGFNINGRFVSLTKIKANTEVLVKCKVNITSDEIFTLVCNRFNVTIEQIKGFSRVNDLDSARQILAMLLYEYIVRSKKVVSNLMNRKSGDSTFQLIEAGLSQMNTNKALSNHYNAIKQLIEK